jgi:hypothetical protein
MDSQFDPEAIMKMPYDPHVWQQIMASIFEQNKRIIEENNRMWKREKEQHELFMMKIKMDSFQVNKDPLGYLQAIKDTQSEVVIADESMERKATTNRLAAEITNEQTLTATTKEQVENTTYINELDTTMINKPAPPNDQSGENLPTKVDNEQAKITYETAEITEPAECQVITEKPAEITQLKTEYESTLSSKRRARNTTRSH